MSEKSKKLIAVIAVVAILLVAIMGATFAYFSASITETDKTQTQLQAAQLGIVFDGTQEILAESIEPGWSAQKKFTVENTSDYDMTYDINFTGVANNFVNTNDLTASGSAVYVQGTNGQTHSGNVEMVAIDASTVASSKSTFALPNSNSYVLPVDDTAVFTNGAVTSVGTNVYKVARVFIPAHAKEEITITLSYAYKAPTSGYTLGDPTDPNNQNADQGKIFRTTFAIVANGIDTGSTQNNANNTTITTDGNGNNNQNNQVSYWTPTYFEYGNPTTLSSTEYPTGHTIFAGLDTEGNKGLCIMVNEEANCFKAGGSSASFEQDHLRTLFSNVGCNETDGGMYCAPGNNDYGIADTGSLRFWNGSPLEDCSIDNNTAIAVCN